MADLKQAQATFKTLCSMLDNQGWHYDKDENGLEINCGVSGDDLPINVRMVVNPQMGIVSLLSNLPFTVPENKRMEVALTVCAINDRLVDGSFDYDYLSGKIVFRITTSFRNSILSEEALKYVLFVSCGTVDDYNDKIYDVTKGHMTVQDVVDFINKD